MLVTYTFPTTAKLWRHSVYFHVALTPPGGAAENCAASRRHDRYAHEQLNRQMARTLRRAKNESSTTNSLGKVTAYVCALHFVHSVHLLTGLTVNTVLPSSRLQTTT